MKTKKSEVVRIRIQELIDRIDKFGVVRNVYRTGKNVKEISNVVFEYHPKEIFKDELTPDEKAKLVEEEKIVFPLIQEQIYEAANLMLNDESTRQAIVYNDKSNATSSVFPCLSIFHFINDERSIDLKTFIRSSDVKKLLFVDCWFLAELQRKFCSIVGKKAGRITLFISNAHFDE